ncbi:c-type cytochrome [Insolitispirillum peregrinum]|uniref:Cytochrome c n=1 Tax=Insolitispirillum peregrinum TaxID=80876 RepID=A0A1N7IIG5_9PROT|nr:c-type cytochrome [Insolitispirillum peregrinum]SIS36894.1 cytochrome c [Insolitispirillum peregrinum]
MKKFVMALSAVAIATLASNAAFAAGDAAAGEKIAKTKCAACHTFETGGANKVGPNLFGVTTRGTGKAANFAYSPLYTAAAAKMASWDAASLDAYLTDPTKTLTEKAGEAKGASKMTFKLPSADDRANVIAYLETLK